MKIWLDDHIEPFSDGWLIARSIKVVKDALERGLVTDLSLDNDLGPHTETGEDLVDWMVESGHWPTNSCTVHSANDIVAQLMRGCITNHFKVKT